MKNKNGWMRILEATIAVLIVAGVLVVVYSKQDLTTQGIDDYVFNIQKKILRDISLNDNFRNIVLSEGLEDFDVLNSFVSNSIPQPPFNYSLKICDLSDPCKLDLEVFQDTISFDVYSEETIISANATTYNPRRVRLFLWEI